MNGAITGTSRLLPVLGDPVQQVRVPALLNPLLARLGARTVVVPVHAPTARLESIMQAFKTAGNVDGLLITVPHKREAVAFADRCTPIVQLTGSTNALRRESDGRWLAANFDGEGFVAGL